MSKVFIFLCSFLTTIFLFGCSKNQDEILTMSFNKNHPELKGDEVFITNSDATSFDRIGWNTKRRGSVAYSPDGDKLGNSWRGAFPVFAKKDEIHKQDPEILKRLEN